MKIQFLVKKKPELKQFKRRYKDHHRTVMQRDESDTFPKLVLFPLRICVYPDGRTDGRHAIVEYNIINNFPSSSSLHTRILEAAD